MTNEHDRLERFGSACLGFTFGILVATTVFVTTRLVEVERESKQGSSCLKSPDYIDALIEVAVLRERLAHADEGLRALRNQIANLEGKLAHVTRVAREAGA